MILLKFNKIDKAGVSNLTLSRGKPAEGEIPKTLSWGGRTSTPALPLPLLLTHWVLTLLPSHDQEKERSWHQQELDKALESLEKEKMELETRLREQQAEAEAIRTQREEERAEAESALCQVGSWGDWSCDPPPSDYFLFHSQECCRRGLPDEKYLFTLLLVSRVTSAVSCRTNSVSHFLREGRCSPHPVSLQTSDNLCTSWFLTSRSRPSLALSPHPICWMRPRAAGMCFWPSR